MPLITSLTNLNKIKFGSDNSGDRFDSGFSSQPYIRTDIPGVDVVNSNPTPITQIDGNGNPIYGNLEPTSPDILLRGGLNAPRDAATDVSRLSKMLFDDKSPNGLIFTTNQNLLSRTSVMTEASYGLGYGRNSKPDFIKGTGGGALPGGVYLPSSTLAQAGVGFTGTHLNLMGLDPTSPNGLTSAASGISGFLGSLGGGSSDALLNGPGGGLRTYSSAMAQNNIPSAFIKENRLVRVYDKKQRSKSKNPDNNVIIYNGGPGSVLGVGKTRIRFAGGNLGGDTRTGLNNALVQSSLEYFIGTVDGYSQKYLSTTLPSGRTAYTKNDLSDKQALSFLYSIPGLNQSLATDQSRVYNMNMLSATYTLESSFILNGGSANNARAIYSNKTSEQDEKVKSSVWNAAQLAAGVQSIGSDIKPDFRKRLIDTAGPSNAKLTTENALGNVVRNILSISPSYPDKNSFKRVNLGDPGSNGPKTIIGGKGDGISGRLNYGIKANEMLALDKINAQTMYVSSGPNPNQDLAVNDFVKFRIAAIDNAPDAGSNAVYMHFRAFLNSFSDNYNASWSTTKFSGRGDNLYNYSGFDRKINLSFTCYAQSKAELIPMYKKLNYLASTMAPDYNTAGFMRGNLVRLTLGGYLYEQPGFISSFTYEAPQESSWEIAINEKGEFDRSVKELPFMIKVTGMTFTPIQDFLPRKIKPNAANGMDGNQMIEERYIALASQLNDSLYKDPYRVQFQDNITDA